MNHKCLSGAGGSIVIGADLWDDLLQWAVETGWRPEYPESDYRNADGLTVSAYDASNLADAFEVIAGDLILQDRKVPDAFLLDLVSGFEKLILFCQAGEFVITNERVRQSRPL